MGTKTKAPTKARATNGMNTEEMTVYRALNERKLMLKKLEDPSVMNSAALVVAIKKSVVESDEAKKVTRESGAQLQSIIDMTHRLAALDAALIESNAKTQITVAGETMCVAAAIQRKSTINTILKKLMTQVTRQVNYATEISAKQTADAETKALNITGARTTEGMNEDTLDMYNKFVELNKSVLIPVDGIKDPTEFISALAAKIDTIEAELDAALSVSNATTTIKFSYTVGSMEI